LHVIFYFKNTQSNWKISFTGKSDTV